MSTFTVPVTLIHPEHRDRSIETAMLVDTGSSYILLPPELVTSLGLQTSMQQRARLASGEVVTYRIGEVRVRIDEDERTTVFWAGPAGCRAILGAVALESFGLAVDPLNRRLMPGPPALL